MKKMLWKCRDLPKPKPTKAQKRHKLAVKIADMLFESFHDGVVITAVIQAIEKILEREGV